jgi:hypothetical protein
MNHFPFRTSVSSVISCKKSAVRFFPLRFSEGSPLFLLEVIRPRSNRRSARRRPDCVMKKFFTLLTLAVCLLAFPILAPMASAQNPAAEEKVIALAQQLKLTPQQEVEVLPILKAEAPKLEAIKNDPSMSGMQKMRALRQIHSENAAPLQKILTPAQYQQLQAIREADIKKAMAAKRAGG